MKTEQIINIIKKMAQRQYSDRVRRVNLIPEAKDRAKDYLSNTAHKYRKNVEVVKFCSKKIKSYT